MRCHPVLYLLYWTNAHLAFSDASVGRLDTNSLLIIDFNYLDEVALCYALVCSCLTEKNVKYCLIYLHPASQNDKVKK